MSQSTTWMDYSIEFPCFGIGIGLSKPKSFGGMSAVFSERFLPAIDSEGGCFDLAERYEPGGSQGPLIGIAPLVPIHHQ